MANAAKNHARTRGFKEVVRAKCSQTNGAFPSRPRIEVVRERLNALKAEELGLRRSCEPWSPVSRQIPLSFSCVLLWCIPYTTGAEDRPFSRILFGARRSVYPKFWENPKTAKKGYAPACHNEWRPGVCRKPQIKCTDCPHQKFPPLDEIAVEAHLRGTHTIGTYAIREDDSCIFLAADFDGEGWQDDAQAYSRPARTQASPLALERSRSGAGGHAWIFFSEPVPCFSRAGWAPLFLPRPRRRRPAMPLHAYDRFFPEPRYDARWRLRESHRTSSRESTARPWAIRFFWVLI